MQLLYNDVGSNHSQLLDKAKRSTVTIVRLRWLCLEIYKTINPLNPDFMTEIFKLSDSKKPVQKQNVLNLKVTRPRQVRYAENYLPAYVKSAPNLLSFKRLMKSWDGISCKCTLCKTL